MTQNSYDPYRVRNSLPFIAVYAHEIVGAAKIELGEDADGVKTV